MPENSLKEKITLNKGEAYVIADVTLFQHIIQMYESQSAHKNDDWQRTADYIRDWVEGTAWYGEDDEEDFV